MDDVFGFFDANYFVMQSMKRHSLEKIPGRKNKLRVARFQGELLIKVGEKSTYQASGLEPEYPADRQPGGEKRMESRTRSKRPQWPQGLGPSASGEIR
jgi:hypothetical protein